MGKRSGRNPNKGGHKNHNNSPSHPYPIQEKFPSYEESQQNRAKKTGDLEAAAQNDNGSRSGNNPNGPIRRGYNPNSYQLKVNEENQRSLQHCNSSHSHRDCKQHKFESQSQCDKSTSDKQGSPQKGSQASDKLSNLKCGLCKDFYNDAEREPRCLPCGHTVCMACLQKLIKSPYCERCRETLHNLKTVGGAPKNYDLIGLVNTRVLGNSGEGKENKKAPEGASCRSKSMTSKPIVTAGASKPSFHSNAEFMQWSTSTSEKSPHGSKCLEIGVAPTSHCATCQKWVCDKCGKIDHCEQRGCFLIAKKEALTQMRDAHLSGVNATRETIDNTLREMQMYEEQLGAFSLTMQAAFEAIGPEKERVRAMMQKGKDKKKELEAAVSAMANDKILPDALSSLRNVEELNSKTRLEIATNASKLLDNKRVIHITKEILLSTVQLKMLAESENNEAVVVLASHTVSGTVLYSRMTVEGGRIYVHSLERIKTVPKGSRAMPLTSVQSCLDRVSALTFLDIGWGGNIKGRLYIRLLGDTLRGRQFLMLCTGEVGPSFRNTTFHRVWWKGLAGEHIWGGDYDKGDGSGGAPVVKITDAEKSSLPSGRTLAITAGLVAGRYEKTNLSSIFRIYTKGAKTVTNESQRYSTGNTTEVSDEAAFGRVEYGLDILESAVNHNNIKDITIYDCGVVIETYGS